MNKYILVAPCHFGLESVLKREIYDLGYEIIKVEDGRVTFEGDEEAICRSNIFLRTTERVMIQVGRFKAYTFDEFFEKVKALDWERYIPEDGRFWVTKANSIKSKLYSSSDIQSLAKKAIVDRLKSVYGIQWFKEDGANYPIRIFFNKDEAMVCLDTSGDSLHKRGYRKMVSKAPISETLAAALIMLTPWHKDRILLDPFCGCGTFPIEAAMIAANIAPGMNREFTGEKWNNVIPKKMWYEAVNEAMDLVDTDIDTDIQGSDIDGEIIKAAMKNAEDAGVANLIHFQRHPVNEVSHRKKYGFIITNPPYGERIEDRENLPSIYGDLGNLYRSLDSWSAYVITSYDKTEEDMGIKATKNRKIYNGMMKTYFYQFLGPKPPKKEGKK